MESDVIVVMADVWHGGMWIIMLSSSKLVWLLHIQYIMQFDILVLHYVFFSWTSVSFWYTRMVIV